MRTSIKQLLPALLLTSCSAFGDLYIGGGYTLSSLDLDGSELFGEPGIGFSPATGELTGPHFTAHAIFPPPLAVAAFEPALLSVPDLSEFDEDNYNGWNVLLGYRFDGPWAVELNYFDSDTESSSVSHGLATVEASVETLSLDLLWNHQLTNWPAVSLIGVAGLVSQRIEASYRIPISLDGPIVSPVPIPREITDSNTETDTRLQLGLGAAYQFTEKLSARAMVKAVPGGFESSDGTPYSVGVSLIYEI
ncbi:porin family protein [Pseudomaricurvus alkylphenolicus]|uniref:outer membrane beta-barrel protein n=1 Tax=Pseudomaricurvus alkylphenolicus TaxID=1306991 RepID=UPI001421820A|nr:outer membrane beta-barrel protein [Pseudomaricurvus alkylphenolicus]NIB42108.1 porin family protein [Pseudomaricurvus alkylphenolicus]